MQGSRGWGEVVGRREAGVWEARVTVAVRSTSGCGSERACVQKSGSDVERRLSGVVDSETVSGSGMPRVQKSCSDSEDRLVVAS